MIRFAVCERERERERECVEGSRYFFFFFFFLPFSLQVGVLDGVSVCSQVRGRRFPALREREGVHARRA